MVAFKRKKNAKNNKNGWNENGKISKKTVVDRRNGGENAKKDDGRKKQLKRKDVCTED